MALMHPRVARALLIFPIGGGFGVVLSYFANIVSFLEANYFSGFLIVGVIFSVTSLFGIGVFLWGILAIIGATVIVFANDPPSYITDTTTILNFWPEFFVGFVIMFGLVIPAIGYILAGILDAAPES